MICLWNNFSLAYCMSLYLPNVFWGMVNFLWVKVLDDSLRLHNNEVMSLKADFSKKLLLVITKEWGNISWIGQVLCHCESFKLLEKLIDFWKLLHIFCNSPSIRGHSSGRASHSFSIQPLSRLQDLSLQEKLKKILKHKNCSYFGFMKSNAINWQEFGRKSLKTCWRVQHLQLALFIQFTSRTMKCLKYSSQNRGSIC